MASGTPWIENQLSKSASIDDKQDGQDVREFILTGDGLDRVEIARRPESFLGGPSGAEALPAKGSQHPTDRDLVLDRYDVEQDGFVFRARALYSSDKRFRYPNTTPEPVEDEVRYQSGREDVTVTIPLIHTKFVTQALPPNVVGPPETRTQYAIDNIEIRETRRKRMWTVLLRTDEVQVAEDAMDFQNNRLHKLLGRWYRFQSGDIIGSGNADLPYQTTYTWWYDRGTPNTSAQLHNVPTGTVLPHYLTGFLPGVQPPPDGWIRPPYHEFIAITNNDASVEPVIGLWIPYVQDENGWQDLFGL